MLRVVVVDDHPALRAGLRAVLDAEPGILFVGESDGQEENVWPVLRRTRPDLVLLDYHLPHGDGLQLCYRIKQEVPSPRVAIHFTGRRSWSASHATSASSRYGEPLTPNPPPTSGAITRMRDSG